MALLDVSEVINDPLFTSPVTLIKSAETISEGGEPVWQDAASADARAVVTSDQKTIDRLMRFNAPARSSCGCWRLTLRRAMARPMTPSCGAGGGLS